MLVIQAVHGIFYKQRPCKRQALERSSAIPESKLTAHVCDIDSSSAVLDGLVMQNETIGGSRETLVKELQVIPRRVPSFPFVVTTTTGEGNLLRTRLESRAKLFSV